MVVHISTYSKTWGMGLHWISKGNVKEAKAINKCSAVQKANESYIEL